MSIQRGIIKLKAVTPVFIGSGQELKKTEYILDRAEGKAYILDVEKFFRYLLQKNLQESYEDFILDPGKKSLKDWMTEHRTQIKRQDIKRFCAYSLDIGNLDMRRSGIKTFLKDGYGQAYIPGSSLKGALRTVLLYNKIQNGELENNVKEAISRNVFSKEKFSRRRFLKSAAENVEELLEETKTIGDEQVIKKMMSGLSISDSHSIESSNLVLCEKEDYGISGKKAGSRIPILRECLKPGTEIIFEFSLNSEKFPFTMEETTKMICDFFQNYQSVYLNMFPEKADYPDCVLCLGGGVGFISKTLLYGIYDTKDAIRVTKEILNKQFPKHNHLQDKKVSPRMRKMTHFQGQLYDMGLCTFMWQNNTFLSAP